MKITEQTKRMAYDDVLSTLGERQAAVFHELHVLGDTGATAGELAQIMFEKRYFPHADRNFVHPRLNELNKLHMVEVTGKRRCSASGKTCGVYRVTEEADRIAYIREEDEQGEQLTLF